MLEVLFGIKRTSEKCCSFNSIQSLTTGIGSASSVQGEIMSTHRSHFTRKLFSFLSKLIYFRFTVVLYFYEITRDISNLCFYFRLARHESYSCIKFSFQYACMNPYLVIFKAIYAMLIFVVYTRDRIFKTTIISRIFRISMTQFIFTYD
jgi:hypothetical protein